MCRNHLTSRKCSVMKTPISINMPGLHSSMLLLKVNSCTSQTWKAVVRLLGAPLPALSCAAECYSIQYDNNDDRCGQGGVYTRKSGLRVYAMQKWRPMGVG